jgi:hypothetical protein
LLTPFNIKFIHPSKNKSFEILQYDKIKFFKIIEGNKTIQIKSHNHNLYSCDIIFEFINVDQIYTSLKSMIYYYHHQLNLKKMF